MVSDEIVDSLFFRQNSLVRTCNNFQVLNYHGVVSSGGAPTPAGTSVFTKHNWDMGMGYLWLNGWGIYHLMGGAFMAYWVGHL